jgi:hypothetical protein
MNEQIELFTPDEVPQVTEWSTQTKATQGMGGNGKRKQKREKQSEGDK